MDTRKTMEEITTEFLKRLNYEMDKFFSVYLLLTGFKGEKTEINLRAQGYSIEAHTFHDRTEFELLKNGEIVSDRLIMRHHVINIHDN